MVEQYQNRKCGKPRINGPYKVDDVYDNGTLRLRHDTIEVGPSTRHGTYGNYTRTWTDHPCWICTAPGMLIL